MFTLDALRPLFSEPDPNLRAFAVRYAVDEASADETLLPLVLAAIGGHEDEVEPLLPAFNLALSAPDARALAARLDGEERPEVQEALVRILGMAPGEVLDAIPEASGAPAIARIARRRALAVTPADLLLEQAAEMDAREPETADADVEVDLGYALAACADVSDERIVQGLEQAVAPGNATTAVLLAAAARRRLRAAVPALIEILFWDEEFAADDAAHALGAIGDPESPAAIMEALEGVDVAPTFAPYEALGRIHTPESERVLLGLLDLAEGWDMEWVVCSLCRLGSLDGVNWALKDFEEAVEDHRAADPAYLEDLAMALQALGRPIPSDLEDALAAQRDDMDSYGGGDLDEPLDPVEAPASDPESDLWWDPERPPSVPYRREAPKVGRNDPCPCGSGKKYKKCHG